MLEPYLDLSGVELANALRTLTYLRRGLGGPMRWVQLSPDAPTDCVSGGGYVDEYVDLYSGDPYPACQLACYCAAIDTGPYQDPAYDMAPWFDPAVSASADFLGFLPEIRLLPVAKRQVGKRQWGGANIGPAVCGPRLVQVRGQMFAASPAGMAYGERWVARVLAGSEAGCAGDILTILPACPDGGDPSAFRELADIGIIDGPTFAPAGGHAECRVEDVAFQLTAGNPWLRKVTTLATVGLGGTPTSSTPVTASLVADAAVVLSFHAGAAPLAGVIVRGKAGNCPVAGTPDVSFEVNGIPASSTLTVDASRRSVEVRNGAGTLLGGFDFLLFPGLFEWLQAVAGGGLCVSVDASAATGAAGATLVIEQVDLEL